VTASALARDDIVRIRSQRWRVIDEVRSGEASLLDVDGYDDENRGIRTHFVLSCERIDRLPTTVGPRVVRPRSWMRTARQELSGAAPRFECLRTVTGARISIIPFQLEPALAITRGLTSRVLLADEVGLGKTIQAGLIAAEVLNRTTGGHVLVVCPAALREQWQVELRERFGLAAALIDSVALARDTWSSPPGAHPWITAPISITSIDYVKRPEVIRALEPIVWDAVVLDEAHTLSGVSERAQAAQSLARRSRLVVLLTATPHSGDEAAFSRLCAFGRLAGDPPMVMFRRNRHDAGLRSSRRTCWLTVRSTDHEVELHRALLAYARLVWRQPGQLDNARLAMSVLMKRACSSAASVQRSLERRLLLLSQPSQIPERQLGLPFEARASDDGEPWALMAAPGLSDLEEERERLRTLVNLAARASRGESKLHALRRLLTRTREAAIVFTEYRDTLEQLKSALEFRETLVLHGGLTMSERRETLKIFSTSPAKVLLATDAASEGLNLHDRCRLVVNVELPWTPLRLEQRVGRVDRIGQTRRVHAIHLVAGGTTEDRIVARVLARSARASAALSAASALGEHHVASRVMDDSFAIEPPPTSPLRGVRVVDLAHAAREEAERIATARTLRHVTPGPSGYPRPVLTALPGKRHNLRGAGCYWAFRATFVDSSGRLLWSTLVAITATSGRRNLRTPDAVHEVLDAERPVLRSAVDRAHDDGLASLTASLGPMLELAVQRELTIARELARTRARLAATQSGLFDRRAERAALAQAAVLDEARSRCTDRLEYLARLRVPTRGANALLFAIALE
jgi:superfamily II DNA or RNA helicase